MDTSTLPPPPPPPPAGPPPPPSPPAGTGPSGPSGTSRRARTAWKVVASVAAVGLLGWGSLQTVSQLAHEERTTVATYDAAGLTTLDARVEFGSVTVVGTDGDEVKVTARISDGLLETSEGQTVVGDRLELRARCPGPISHFCNVAYTVELPADMAVRVRVGNDDVRLTGIDGDIDAHSGNGDVEVRGSGTGRLVLGSDNGNVDAVDLRASEVDADSDNGDVSLVFGRGPTWVEATSDNGDVSVVVPDDGQPYAVSTGSANGSTAAPIRTDPTASRSISVRSSNGDVQVTYLPR